MKPSILYPALVVGFFFLPYAAADSHIPFPMEEHDFLEKPFNFSSEEEKPLDEKLLQPPAKAFPFASARLGKVNGVATMFVNDEPMPTWSRAITAPIPGVPVERQMREQGMRIFIVDVNLTAAGHHLGDRSLKTAPEPAFAQFEERAGRLLEEVPDAIIVPRLWMLNVAEDYVQAHPDELLQGENGATDWGWGYYYAEHNVRPNMLNAWRRYCGEHLRRFIHRVGGSRFAPHVAGFYIAAMNSGEWWYYKGKGDPGWDYSPSRRKAFEKFVRAKYGDDPAAVAAAWGIPVRSSLFELPSMKMRRQWPFEPLSKVSDYLQTLNLPITEAADFFGKIIKTSTGGRSLAGMEIHAAFITNPSNGTVFFRHLLESPNIDFFGGPSDYPNRKPGETPLYRVAHSTLEEHGKLWWNEGDYRSHMAFATPSGAAGEPPPDAASMRHVLRREFARGAIFNYSTYLMDFGWNWFYEPSLLNEIGNLLTADQFIKDIGLQRRNQIAVVTDQESQIYSSSYSNPLSFMLRDTLDRLGTGWDFWELTDFLKTDHMENYRFIIFLNIRALSKAERAGLEKLKSDGRLLLWMHDPGVTDLSSRGRSAEELASNLTGLHLRSGPISKTVSILPEAFAKAGLQPPVRKNISVDSRAARLFQEVSPSDAAEGRLTGNLPSPLYCQDNDAISLAVDSEGHSRLALRDFENWTSVFTSFCQLEPSIVRQLARRAGCFLFLDTDDVVFAARNFLGIHASSDGEKTIALPQVSDVFDVFQHQTLHKNVVQLTVVMRRGETRFFYLGNGQDAEKYIEAILQTKKNSLKDFVKAHPAGSIHDSFKKYHPRALEKGGTFAITSAYTPPVLLVSEPFGYTEADIIHLDEKLALLRSIEQWRPLPTGSNGVKFGMNSDNFLHVTRPLPNSIVSDAPLCWHGVDLQNSPWNRELPEIWISDYRLGITTGQSYAVACLITAQEETRLRFFLAPEGDARLWVDGEEVRPQSNGIFEPLLTASPKPKLIVFRIRGNTQPTGFAAKFAEQERGRKAYTQRRPGTYDLDIAADKDSLNPPPPGLMLYIPAFTDGTPASDQARIVGEDSNK